MSDFEQGVEQVAALSKEVRELKSILDYFIAEFNVGNLQSIESAGGPMMFMESKYDIPMDDGKITLIKKSEYEIVGGLYVKKDEAGAGDSV